MIRTFWPKPTTFFTSRGYPANTVREAFNRACATSRTQAMTPKPTSDTEDRPVLTIVYHPHNLPVKDILLKNFHILQQDPKLNTVFKKPPLVAYKRDTSLRNHLAHSSTNISQTSLPHGSSPCTCPNAKPVLSSAQPHSSPDHPASSVSGHPSPVSQKTWSTSFPAPYATNCT